MLVGEELKDSYPIGSRVYSEGNKDTGRFYGEIMGFAPYRKWLDAKVRKWNGKIVMCHLVNLHHVDYKYQRR